MQHIEQHAIVALAQVGRPDVAGDHTLAMQVVLV